MTFEQVLRAAMELSREEREQLAERLLAGLPARPEIAERWHDEAERRRAQLDAGEARTVPLREVWASLGLDVEVSEEALDAMDEIIASRADSSASAGVPDWVGMVDGEPTLADADEDELLRGFGES